MDLKKLANSFLSSAYLNHFVFYIDVINRNGNRFTVNPESSFCYNPDILPENIFICSLSFQCIRPLASNSIAAALLSTELRNEPFAFPFSRDPLTLSDKCPIHNQTAYIHVFGPGGTFLESVALSGPAYKRL